jgi:hypothetical protein
MVRSSSANPAKVKKAIKFLIKQPDMKVPQVMKLIGFSDKEVANLSLHRFIQRSLPGKTMQGLNALLLGPLPPPLMPPDRAKQLCHRAINVTGIRIEEAPSSAGLATCERVLEVTPSPFPPRASPMALPQGQPSPGVALTAAEKRKSRN